jgi:hypothetical protein
MRTTLELPDDLFRRVKLKAVSEGKTLKTFLEETIEAALSNQAKQPGIRRKHFSGVIRGKAGPAMAKMGNEMIADLESE